MKTRPGILFWFRKNVRNPDRPGTIYCRITVKGVEQNFATGIRTMREEWSSEAQRLRGKSLAVKLANDALTKLEDTLNDLAADLARQGKPITPRRLWELHENDGAVLSMVELVEAFLAERESLIGYEISQSSFDTYKCRYVVMHAFLEANKRLDLRPEEFTHNLADKMLHWCLKERGYQRNYFRKVIQSVMQCLRWGVRREHLDKNPLNLYECKAPATKELLYLNVGELQALTAFKFPSSAPYLERVRDLFVFQCWTGLAYADLAALDVRRSAEYHRDAQGVVRRVLRVRRAKSTLQQDFDCVIPLLPEAERVLAQYGDVLPVPSNPFYNRTLKEIGEYCGFSAGQMTTHVGRKTAGVMMLNLGIRMETVSKFLGHSSVKTTEKLYAKILDTTVVDDFSKLFTATSAPVAAAPAAYELPPAKPEPAPVPVTHCALQPASIGASLWARPTAIRKGVASA